MCPVNLLDHIKEISALETIGRIAKSKSINPATLIQPPKWTMDLVGYHGLIL
jgi:hypothetical protein